jgi:YtkA-like
VFPVQSLMSVTSSGAKLRIDVRTAPEQPPSRGVQAVQLVITDAASGAPATGLSLSVLPWMPAMAHGSPLVPTVTEDPGGVYVVEDVDFFMAGTWELRTTFSGSLVDYAAPSFQIP